VPFRYGGEEFAVLLADTDAEGALQVAESLRQAVEALKIPNEGSPSGKNLSLSLGLAVCSPKNSSDERGLLLKNADEALYRAKKSGRNQVAVQ
jgi:diguanylate cyclase (GGDEF)-like protein